MRQTAAYFALVVFSLTTMAQAGNWAHWRGPDGNSAAEDASPPTEWSSTKNIKWKYPLPRRENSSPIVWEDRVFITVAAPVDQLIVGELPTLEFNVICLNREDGKVRWKRTATVAKPHQRTHSTNGFAGASPCTDGEHVYAHFGSRGLYCYTMDGELSWSKDFGDMETLNDFGEGSSPTLEGNMILVPWDHQGPSALYALNKRTGDVIWKTDRDEPTGWATPMVVEHDGRKQVIMNGQNFTRSYDLETGKELWRCSGQTVRPIPSPVADRERGIVFVGSGFRRAFMGAFRLDGKGDIEGTDQVVWEIEDDKRVMTDMASPMLSEGRMYYFNGKVAVLSCIDAFTGKPHYLAQRINGLGNKQVYSSPVAAGGNVYLTTVDGTTVVIKDADELEVVATNELGEAVGGTPAPAGDELFIRGAEHLFCIAESE